MFVDHKVYKKVFEAYLRKGTPIEWSIKQARPSNDYVELSGSLEIYLDDEFADPLDIGIEFFGTPYPIKGTWPGSVNGRIYADASRSA